MADDKVRVSLILDDDIISGKYLVEVINMLEHSNVEVPLIAIDKTTVGVDIVESPPDHSILKMIAYRGRKIIQNKPSVLYYAESEISRRLVPWKTAEEKRDELYDTSSHIDEIDAFDDSKRVYFEPKKAGDIVYEIPDNVVDEIIEKTDVVVLIGFNRILRGRILNEPKFGTLSFHESDIRKYRGRPKGFWEFLNNENDVGVTLQQLTEDLDGGNIVVCETTDISDAKTLWEVRLRSDELYGTILVKAIGRLQDPEFVCTKLSNKSIGQLSYQHERNRWRNAVRVLVKNTYRRYVRRFIN